jgi:uncharacterized protein (UPF0303 family)
MNESEITTLIEQEERLQFSAFDNERAVRLGLALYEAARSRNVAVTIDVRTPNYQIFHLAMDGTTPNNDAWVTRKSNVVLRFHTSSYRLGRELARDDDTLEQRQCVDPEEYAAHGGSFPIRVRGVGVVAAVTVSGLPQRDDHELVVSTLEAFLSDAR